MNEMRRLEEIRDQCCRLRESAAADVAAERKVSTGPLQPSHMAHDVLQIYFRRFVKTGLSCCGSSKRSHSRSSLVCGG